MFPGINPKQVEKMMKQMGIKQIDIPAEEVIIKLKDKDLIIKNPKVSKVNMMGQETIQITGDIEEREIKAPITEDDVKVVAEQSNVSLDEAEKALIDSNGNLAEAILKLKQ